MALFHYFCEDCRKGTPHVVLFIKTEGKKLSISTVKCSHCSAKPFDVEHATGSIPLYNSRRLDIHPRVERQRKIRIKKTKTHQY